MQIQTQLQLQATTRWMLELESTPGRRTAPYRRAGCAAPPPPGPALRSGSRAAWALLHTTPRRAPKPGRRRKERKRRGIFLFLPHSFPLPPQWGGVSKGTGIATRFSRNTTEGILKELGEKTHSQEVISHAKLCKELKMIFFFAFCLPSPSPREGSNNAILFPQCLFIYFFPLGWKADEY